MYRPRIIPVLLLRNQVLVKTRRFGEGTYIGDPINAVRIFNDSMADEMVVLDINATRESRTVSLDFVRNLGEEAEMPFAVGGGIKTIDQIRQIINAGAEKVIIGTAAAENPTFIKEAAETFGSSTIVVCMDVKKKVLGGKEVKIRNGNRSSGKKPVEFAQEMEALGVGELIIQSIDNDGMRKGYDVDLIKSVADSVSIPVVALGGAGSFSDMKEAFKNGNASGLAAGSLFVFHANSNGVLINYPEDKINILR